MSLASLLSFKNCSLFFSFRLCLTLSVDAVRPLRSIDAGTLLYAISFFLKEDVLIEEIEETEKEETEEETLKSAPEVSKK